MGARKPPQSPEQRLVRWMRSMAPGTLNGRVAAAAPMAVDQASLAPRVRALHEPGPTLNTLPDVDPTGLADKNVPVWDAATNRWKPGAAGPSASLLWEYDEFTGDAATTNFTLSFQPYGINHVALDGVVKRQGTDFTFSARFGIIVFASAPGAGVVISVSYVTAGATPSASVTDNFNRADSATTLGDTSDGQYTWGVARPGFTPSIWGINSNQAYMPGSAAQNIAYIDTGLSDGVVQATAATLDLGAGCGVVFRFVDSTHYWVVYALSGTNGGQLYKVDTGNVFTAVGAAFTVTNGQTLQATVSGSSITVRRSGTVVVTATDSYLVSATAWGMFSESNAPRLDDFSWTPL